MTFKTKKFDALILAGGFGTRMSKSFPGVPKALIPVAGVPMLQHVLAECWEHEIKNVLISVFHQKEQIFDFVQDGSKFGLNVEYVVETTPVGTGGALFLAQEFLADNFVVLYGDVFSNLNLTNLKRYHLKNLSDITCVVHPNDHPFDSDLVEADENGRIIRLLPKNVERQKLYKNQAVAAMYCMSKKIFQMEVDLPKFDIATDLVPICINQGMKVNAYQTVEYIKDMGSPDRYRNVSLAIEQNLHLSRSSKIKRVAVIFDRDGTINVENGHIASPDDLSLANGASDAIRSINHSQYLALCATNQPVLSRGDITTQGIYEIHKKLDTLLGLNGAYLDDLIYCPHHPDKGFEGEVEDLKIQCDCRKPNSGMIDYYVNKYHLDKQKSVMIGDRFSDVKAASRGGINSILLMSGAKDKQKGLACRPTFCTESVSDATNWILSDFQKLLKVAKKIYLQLKNNRQPIFLSGKSNDACRAVSRMLQQHFIFDSVVFDFNGELRYCDDKVKSTEEKLASIFESLSLQNQLNYSEVISFSDCPDTWVCPPVDLTENTTLIVPIGPTQISFGGKHCYNLDCFFA